MGLRVLLITYYLIREKLVKAILDIHVRGVKIKNFLDPDIITMYLLQKDFIKKILVLVCTRIIICSLREYDRKHGWVNV